MPELPDPVALVVAELASHPGLEGVVAPNGQGDAALWNVSGSVVGPWPCLRVLETPAGSDRRLIHDTEPELQLELWDDPLPANQLGPTELRRRLYVVLQLLVDLVETREWAAGEPVLSRVRSTTRGAYLPDPTDGQPRYLATVAAVVHPATA